jgi:hypothetical protein
MTCGASRNGRPGEVNNGTLPIVCRSHHRRNPTMQPPEDPYNPQGQQPPYGQQPPGSYPQPEQQPPGSYPQPEQQPPGSYPPPEQQPPGSYPPPPAYGQQPGSYPTPPPYGAPGTAPSNTLGLVAMILGIAAIPLLCCFYLGIPLGIAGIVLGFMGKKRADQGLATNRGQAQAGLICGAVAVGLGIVLVILNVAFHAMDFTSYYNR